MRSAPRKLAGPATASDDARWEAVVDRVDGSDGCFVYAVRTTGIYCRPTCGARRPKRTNVEFFGSSLEAESAGYRPCKRCRPRSPALHDRRVSLVTEACRQIAEAESAPSLEDLAATSGLSASRFQRMFKQFTGVTPKQYATAVRAAHLRAALARGDSVTQALYAAGFGSSSRLYENWAWLLGMPPAAYGAGGRGELILYATVATPLGMLLAASTRRGVCSLAFGDSSIALEADLRKQFANATLIVGDAEYRQWLQTATGQTLPLETLRHLPLDIQGTLFMQRVWRALREIPTGQTRSYAEIAQAIGAPDAVRAVGSACGKNRLAVAIPCHRALRSDGGLGGYRWGLERKQALLDAEQEP